MQGLNDPVKCECVGRLFAGRGLDVLALSIWLDSAGSSGVLAGVLGVTSPMMAERLNVWWHLSWSTKGVLSSCNE